MQYQLFLKLRLRPLTQFHHHRSRRFGMFATLLTLVAPTLALMPGLFLGRGMSSIVIPTAINIIQELLLEPPITCIIPCHVQLGILGVPLGVPAYTPMHRGLRLGLKMLLQVHGLSGRVLGHNNLVLRSRPHAPTIILRLPLLRYRARLHRAHQHRTHQHRGRQHRAHQRQSHRHRARLHRARLQQICRRWSQQWLERSRTM